ncbi:hypothetical protein FSPOR_5933 [Fusarium sporotrichioides]|uniref:Uncharacterized protein n=1 Tax=Fusarium sporotrichioides TaxID=5514 RepID=A0A395S5R6_FUSSP|nr:hypothetical protein FSPOR_5933 [Fusarium sporotrichioides]
MVNQPPKKTAGRGRPVAGPQRPPAGRPAQNPTQRPSGYQQVDAPRPVAGRPVVGRQPAPSQGMQMAQMRRPQQQANRGGSRPTQAMRPGPPRGQNSRPQHVQHVQHIQHVHHRPVQQAGHAPAPRPAQGYSHAHKSGSSSNMRTVAGGAAAGAALGIGGAVIYNQMNSSTNIVNQEHNDYSSENNNWQYDNYEQTNYQQDNHYDDNNNYYDNGEYYSDNQSSDNGGNYNNNYDPDAGSNSDGNYNQYDEQPGDYTQTPVQGSTVGNNGGEEEGCCGDCGCDDCCVWDEDSM